MVCPSCGIEVSVRQPFCNGCGASLRGVTDPTEPLEPVDKDPLPPTEPLEIGYLQPTQPIDVDAAEADLPITELSPPTVGDVTTEMFAPPTSPPVTTMEMPTAAPRSSTGSTTWSLFRPSGNGSVFGSSSSRRSSGPLPH